MKQVTILYFGLLREAAGCTEETVETDAASVQALFLERAGVHGIDIADVQLKFARNEVFCSPDEPVSNGDTIACMPPMAGG